MRRDKLSRRTARATELRNRWMLRRAMEQLALEMNDALMRRTLADGFMPRTTEHFEPIVFRGAYMGGYINKAAVRLLDLRRSER